MATPLKDFFGSNLSLLLAQKIKPIYRDFNSKAFINGMQKQEANLALKGRIQLQAELLYKYLPKDYTTVLQLFEQLYGEENPNETGMFTYYYWLSPIAKYIEMYGLQDYKKSIKAMEHITKRNTAEFTIRPFIHLYPTKCLEQCMRWATHKNFHIRRLASEGLRPKLPWATQLNLFVQEPKQVFAILTTLKNDPIRYVQKSVANHINDYLKLNATAAQHLIKEWEHSATSTIHTQWIIQHATRNERKRK